MQPLNGLFKTGLNWTCRLLEVSLDQEDNRRKIPLIFELAFPETETGTLRKFLLLFSSNIENDVCRMSSTEREIQGQKPPTTSRCQLQQILQVLYFRFDVFVQRVEVVNLHVDHPIAHHLKVPHSQQL
jgi:hypothetical protein